MVVLVVFLLLSFFRFIFFCIYESFAHVLYMYTICTCMVPSRRLKEGIGSPELDGYEHSVGVGN